ncbi:hypothetical protein BGZ65_011545, partial [Modicella reniformis]
SAKWGPESNETIIKEFENESCPWGGMTGDMIKATPDRISRAFLEEQVFKSWYHERTIYWRCCNGGGGETEEEEYNVSTGCQRAAMVFQDAIVLANCLYFMLDDSPKSITDASQEYYRQRYDHIQKVYKDSVNMSRLTY